MPQPSDGRVTVVVSDSNLSRHRDELESLVGEFADCLWVDDPTSKEALELLASAEIYVGMRFTSAMAPHASRLKLVLVGGAGYDGIDLDVLPPGTQVANTFNHESSIAEYVVATTVLLRRGLLAQHRALARGEWASSVYDSAITQPPSLQDANVGILGYGHIGKAVWEAFRALGANGRAVRHSPSDTTPDGLIWLGTIADLDSLLLESDVLAICLPLNEATRGIIGADRLARLGPDAVVVNVGRGPLVDEDALYAALRDRTIAAAALDVWYRYPDTSGRALPATQPFWELPNVLLTPHISGVTSSTFRKRVQDIADNIARQVTGRPIQRVVHQQR